MKAEIQQVLRRLSKHESPSGKSDDTFDTSQVILELVGLIENEEIFYHPESGQSFKVRIYQGATSPSRFTIILRSAKDPKVTQEFEITVREREI